VSGGSVPSRTQPQNCFGETQTEAPRQITLADRSLVDIFGSAPPQKARLGIFDAGRCVNLEAE